MLGNVVFEDGWMESIRDSRPDLLSTMERLPLVSEFVEIAVLLLHTAGFPISYIGHNKLGKLFS